MPLIPFPSNKEPCKFRRRPRPEEAGQGRPDARDWFVCDWAALVGNIIELTIGE